jgi:hypothetical protein
VDIIILEFIRLTGPSKKTFRLPSNGFDRASFFEALIKSPRLERIYVQPSYDNLYHLSTLAGIPSLKAIIVGIHAQDSLLDQVINDHPKLMTLIQHEFTLSSSRNIIPTPSNSAPPMSSVSADVQDKIWSRVLEYALKIRLLNGELDHSTHYWDRTQGGLLLVSKKFSVSHIIHNRVDDL